FFFCGTPCSLLVISRLLIVVLCAEHHTHSVLTQHVSSFFVRFTRLLSYAPLNCAVLSRVPDLYLPVPTAEALVLPPVTGNAFFWCVFFPCTRVALDTNFLVSVLRQCECVRLSGRCTLIGLFLYI
ncbi:hypothetical protein EXIGLDRAFT_719647, partial [Exidia glandulosa HHB12029]